MGFQRRYTADPTLQQIQLVEGLVIVDKPQPGPIQGTGSGTACCIGEFADVTRSIKTDGSGGIATEYKPTQVFGVADAVQKFGGFDATIGDFGISGGNGYVDAFKNKQFQALVCVAINLASAKGGRFFRCLPTNTSATDPSPAQALQAASVPASYEFKTAGGNRVRCAGAQQFTDTAAYASGTDGSLTAAATAVVQSFTSVSLATAIAAGLVQVGDILVLGVIGDATYGVATIMNTYYGTYRVKTCPSGGPITFEQLDGTTFAIPTQATIPWRLHAAATADTAAGGQAANPGCLAATAKGFTVPMRPLDATIAAGAVVPPTTVPAVPTATTWDPLSCLNLLTLATTGSLVYTAAVQGPNVAYSSTNAALYTAAMDSLLSDDQPGRDVDVFWTARTGVTIRSYGKTTATTRSQRGKGLMFVSAPGLDTQTVAAAAGGSSPGVGANRDERVIYTWPGTQVYVAEAVSTAIATAIAGQNTTDGMLDARMDGFIASILSVLPPERNPGQTAPPVGGSGGVLSVLGGFQRGVSGLTIDAYAYMKSQGVAALHFDSAQGPEILSGITSSLTNGQKNINRRRFADFIEDSVATALQPFVKLPVTKNLIDTAQGEVDNFLAQMLSPFNPSAQRLADYSVDARSGNTKAMLAQGVFVIKVAVQMLPTADFIVTAVDVGPSVVIQATVGAGGVQTTST